MAAYSFQFYFQSGAGTVTVNGVAPAATYEEGTPLNIGVSFSDGNTTVQWIINNASEGTDNPLAYVMPSQPVYIRVIGSGAPVVTNDFSFFWRFGNGIGSFTVNSGVASPFYAAGTSLTIETVLVPGFTFTDFNINNGLFIGLTNPYTFTMPSADVNIMVNSTGDYDPIDNYGIKYTSEFCDITGQEILLEIREKGYAGYPESVKSAGVRYSWGNQGIDVLETIVGSSINFGLIGERDQYFELLSGGNRKWQVKLYIDSLIFWTGYINTSFLSVSEVSNSILQEQRFTASDGLKSFEAIRAIESYFTRISSGFEMVKTIASAINQTFDVLRPVNIACSIYETRLDRSVGLFEQLLVPDAAIYKDGEQPLFFDGNNVQLNTSLFLSECIDRMLKPFMCRLFLWKDEFYIISVPELNKSDYELFNYDVYGVSTGLQTIGSGLDLSCKFTNGQRTGRSVYTEFNTVLKLDSLDVAAQGGLIEYSFQQEDWDLLGPSTPYPGVYKLTNWNYRRCIPSGQPDAYPTGSSNALIQYVSNSYGEYAKFWGTSSSDGLDDINIAYIEIDTYRNKNPIQVAQEISNTLSFKIEFLLENRSVEVLPVNQFFGVMIQVGNSYMSWDGNQAFSWVGSFNVMQFPVLNAYTWNIIDILPLVIPEDGIVTVRLYQLINDGEFPDRYSICFRKMSLKIEQNKGFVDSELLDKFITDETYSLVYPDIDIYIGDVSTDNSTAAIKLNVPEWSYPHSSLWSIDGTVEIRLAQILLQEVANINGEGNFRIIATALRDGVNPLEVVPLQNVIYDGGYWMVLAINLDFQLNTWQIELIKLGDIGS